MSRLLTTLRLIPLAAAFALSAPSAAVAGHGNSTVSTKTRRKKIIKKKKVVRKRAARRGPPKPRISETMLKTGSTGLVIGAGFATQTDDHATGSTENSYGTETGFIIGARYDKIMNRFLGYRVAMQYHSKGSSATTNNVKTEVNLGYLEVPAALFARFKVNRMITPYIYFGPYAAMLLQKEVKIDGNKNKSAADGYSYLD